MEIISYVLEGDLAHKDTLGNVKGIPPGDVQRMSAGTGVQHSEFNHAKDQTTHFLQIWIEPNVTGIPASYEQKTFADSEKRGRLRLVASPDGAEGSVLIHADARVYAGLFDARRELQPGARPGAQGLRARGARRARSERQAPGGGRCGHARGRGRRSRWRPARPPRCWCSTWRRTDFFATAEAD